MRKYFHILTIICCSLVFSGVHAQPGQSPKQVINGEQNYVYTVEAGNTLYAISRMFAIDVDDLKAANPGADQGLKVGQKIYIPLKEINKRQLRKQPVSAQGNFLIHKVQRKETLFSIAQDYQVDVNDLLEANPDADKGIRTGQELKIPVDKIKHVAADITAPAVRDSFKIHTVSAGETLYSISRMYNTTVDSLKIVNNNFPDGLRAGMTIRIPEYTRQHEAQLAERQSEADSIRLANATHNVYNIALILPFELDQIDSLLRSDNLGAKVHLNVLTRIALDYYRGTMLALDSLKKLGFNANLYVYDVGEDVVDARQLTKRPEMQNMQLIIGPFHKASLAVMSDFSRVHHIPLVTPNALAGDVIDENPLLLNPAASEVRRLHYLGRQVALRHAQDHVVMVINDNAKDAHFRQLFREGYSGDSTLLTAPLATMNPGAFGLDKIQAALSKTKKNVLVVPSTDIGFVADLMTRLSQLSDDYQIDVYGLEVWQDYDNIEAAYKCRFHWRLPAGRFVDYSSPKVIDFLKKYRNKYHTEPDRFEFGFTGFDCMMFFGGNLMQFGTDFPSHLTQESASGLQTDFTMRHSLKGNGYDNGEVFLLEYNNYEIHRIP